MMVEQELESKIVDALEALEVPGLVVRGLWNPVADGEVKGQEGSDIPVAAVVRVSPRSYGDYGVPTVTCECAVALAARVDLDPTGAILSSAAEAISDRLAAWHDNVCVADGDGLSFEGFMAAGFMVTGGSGPTFDEAAGAWAVTFNFTVSGTLVDEPTDELTT